MYVWVGAYVYVREGICRDATLLHNDSHHHQLHNLYHHCNDRFGCAQHNTYTLHTQTHPSHTRNTHITNITYAYGCIDHNTQQTNNTHKTHNLIHTTHTIHIKHNTHKMH